MWMPLESCLQVPVLLADIPMAAFPAEWWHVLNLLYTITLIFTEVL